VGERSDFSRYNRHLVPLTPVASGGSVSGDRLPAYPALKDLPAGAAVTLETSSPGPSTDSATIETIRRMAGYIRKCIGDRQCQAAARYAWERFGAGRTDPMSLAWAAFWYVKHCVRFRSDEATMLRIGAAGNYDLLIAPDVLTRMDAPAEDC